MLFPYRDENPTYRFPVITVTIIAINVAVFLYQVFGSMGYENFIIQYAMIPQEIFTGKNLENSTLTNPYLTVITFMFLHGNLQHLVFNMLFLWIFGNNVEDRMSRPGFSAFYILTGTISGLAFALLAGGVTPLVGASGAISGILGAYLFMFPLAKVRAIFIIFRVRMPAFIYIIFWFVTQISGLLDAGRTGRAAGNVAWEAHVFGFISGVILFKLFARKKSSRQAWFNRP